MKSRRSFLLAGASAAGIAALGAAYWNDRSSKQTARRAGPDRFVSSGNVADVQLTASEARFALAGGEVSGMAFNGRVPGPTIEVRPRDTVRLSFQNELGNPTNLHYHGLHVPPSGNADNIFLHIPAGESFAYEFTIPQDHPAGLFWYHPHLHGLVADQVSQGLAGPLIVRGPLDDIPEIAAAKEHLMVLQDWDVEGGRVVGASMPERMMMGREGSLLTVNAMVNPVITARRGELLRLRFLNASSSRFYWLGLDGVLMHLTATDGGGLPRPEAVERLLLTPGERADVLVEGTEAERDVHCGTSV